MKGCPEAGASGGHTQVHTNVLGAGEDSDILRAAGPLSSRDHQAPDNKRKEQMKSNGLISRQNNATSFFTGPSPTGLLAGTEALVQLCPGKNRTGTALVEPPRLLTEEKLSAKMPAAMPPYPATPDCGFHTVNLLLRHYWDKTPIALSRGNPDFPSLLWAR